MSVRAPLEVFLVRKQVRCCCVFRVEIAHRTLCVHRVDERSEHLDLAQRWGCNAIANVWEPPIFSSLQVVVRGRLQISPVTALPPSVSTHAHGSVSLSSAHVISRMSYPPSCGHRVAVLQMPAFACGLGGEVAVLCAAQTAVCAGRYVGGCTLRCRRRDRAGSGRLSLCSERFLSRR